MRGKRIKIGPQNYSRLTNSHRLKIFYVGAIVLSEPDLVVYETQEERDQRLARENRLDAWRQKRSRNGARNTSMRREVMARAEQCCEVCRFNFWGILNVHHIMPVSHGGQSRRKNLIVLCPNCHAMAHHYSRGVHDPADPARIGGVMSAGYSEKQARALLLVASRYAAVRDDGTIHPYRAPEDLTRYVLVESQPLETTTT